MVELVPEASVRMPVTLSTDRPLGQETARESQPVPDTGTSWTLALAVFEATMSTVVVPEATTSFELPSPSTVMVQEPTARSLKAKEPEEDEVNGIVAPEGPLPLA